MRLVVKELSVLSCNILMANLKYYNQEFGNSYLQLKPLDRAEVVGSKEIKVEILIDENLIKFAVTEVTMTEATALIKYYFELDEIGNIDSCGVGYP